MHNQLKLFNLGLNFYCLEDATSNFYNCRYEKARYWFEKAHTKGSAPAGFYLGLIYRDGLGVAPDFAKAVEYFERYIVLEDKLGHKNPLKRFPADVLYQIGVSFYRGENGAPQDYNQARTWLERARSKGNVDANYYIALLYQYGNGGVKASLLVAKKYFEEGASKGDKIATKRLNEINHEISVIKRKNSFEIARLAKPYYQPGPKCNYDLACMYYEWIIEKGVDGFIDSKLISFLRSPLDPLRREKGLLALTYARTGLMYISSKHPKPDFDKGIRYLHKAVQLGYTPAQKALDSLKPDNITSSTTSCLLGMAFDPNRYDNKYQGIALTPNASLARLWYEDAARQADRTACYNLGEIYENGENVAVDPVKAAQYYQKAVNLGHPSSRRLDLLIKSGRATISQAAIDPTLIKSSGAEADPLDKFRWAAANNVTKIRELLNKQPELLNAGCPVNDNQSLYNAGVALGKTVSWGGVATAVGLTIPPSALASVPIAAWKTYEAWCQDNIATRSRKGWTMLEFAAEAQATDVVAELLHKKGVEITPLFKQLIAIARDNQSFFERTMDALSNRRSFLDRCLDELKRKEARDAQNDGLENQVQEATKQSDILRLELIKQTYELVEKTRNLCLVQQHFDNLKPVAFYMAGFMYGDRGLFDELLNIPTEMAREDGEKKIEIYLSSKLVIDIFRDIDVSKRSDINERLEDIRDTLEFLKKMRRSPNEEVTKLATALYAKIKAEYKVIKEKMLQPAKPVDAIKKTPQTTGTTGTTDATKPTAATPLPPKQPEPVQANPLPNKEDVVDRETITTLLTEGKGDCAFHAVFGKWDGNIIRCEKVQERREKLAQGIERNDKSITPYILEGIKALVLDLQEDTHGKPAMTSLLQAFQTWQRKNDRDRENAWKAFEEKLKENVELISQIDDFIKQLSPKVQKTYNKSLRARFSKTLNDDKEHKLKNAMDKHPQLMTLYEEVKKYGNVDFWATYQVTDDVLKEFAAYIKTMGVWLSQPNLLMVAFFFDISIDLYEKNNEKGITILANEINPGQTDKVAICFDGIGHYEQIKTPTVNAAKASTPDTKTGATPQPPSPNQGFFKPERIQKQYAFGLLEARAIYDDPDESILEAIRANIMKNPVQKARLPGGSRPGFWSLETMQQHISHEIETHPAKYKESEMINLDLEAFCECLQIPCFLAIEDGGFYMGSQYSRPDNPPLLIGINDDDLYRALELPKGKDMAWLETILKSKTVLIVEYDETQKTIAQAV